MSFQLELQPSGDASGAKFLQLTFGVRIDADEVAEIRRLADAARLAAKEPADEIETPEQARVESFAEELASEEAEYQGLLAAGEQARATHRKALTRETRDAVAEVEVEAAKCARRLQQMSSEIRQLQREADAARSRADEKARSVRKERVRQERGAAHWKAYQSLRPMLGELLRVESMKERYAA